MYYSLQSCIVWLIFHYISGSQTGELLPGMVDFEFTAKINFNIFLKDTYHYMG